jgi:3-deoxy-manno-octulosonate cytidylyltransferase (CMP-KDO synthetase)
MKVIGVIPARYASTRLPGKPIIDICGKPMIWWVYQQVRKVKEFSEIYVVTDDERISTVCNANNMKMLMTKNHPDHISRIWEVSTMIDADWYVCVNGDEPLVEYENIHAVIPVNTMSNVPYFGTLMRTISNPVEVIDSANIKVVVNRNSDCVFLSRTPIPFPKGTLNFEYKKYVGIECANKEALHFFVNASMGEIEKIEDIDHLRFIENGIRLHLTQVNSASFSVDTPKDLEEVRVIIQQRIDSEQITI